MKIIKIISAVLLAPFALAACALYAIVTGLRCIVFIPAAIIVGFGFKDEDLADGIFKAAFWPVPLD